MTSRSDRPVPSPDCLERAISQLTSAHSPMVSLAPDARLMRSELAVVAEVVRKAVDGRVPGPPERMQMDRLRLLRMLRSAVLEVWTDDDGSPLPTMRAFESAERALSAAGEGRPPGEALSPFSRNLLREVAHLLRSPLGSMVVLTEALREERAGPLTEAQRRQIGIIYRAALSAASTATDLLTLTSQDQLVERERRFSVAETVRTVADVVRPVTEVRNSHLSVGGDVAGYRRGPESAIRQALLGLALRAALMTREGRLDIEAWGHDPELVRLSVTIHDPGDTSADAVVDPLEIFRPDPESGSFTLSRDGIAFSAAREIIRTVGSELEVASLPEGGFSLSFSVVLPVAD
jgi:signal transduction histidine kinase